MPDEHPLKRWFPRRKVSLPCLVSWQDRLIPARTVDVSYAGIGVFLSEAIDVNVEVLVQVPEGIRLRVRPVYRQQENSENFHVGCKVELIERGEQQWANLCYVPRWESCGPANQNSRLHAIALVLHAGHAIIKFRV